MKDIKVAMVSLGCAKNRVDAEMMMYKIKEAGFILKDDPAKADIAIVNTCGFIESAKQESIEEIIELGKLKEEGTIKHIVVTGCLAERYKEQIAAELPEADAVIGLGANGDIVETLKAVAQGIHTESFPDKSLQPLSDKRLQSTPLHYAYLGLQTDATTVAPTVQFPSFAEASAAAGWRRSLKRRSTLYRAE